MFDRWLRTEIGQPPDEKRARKAGDDRKPHKFLVQWPETSTLYDAAFSTAQLRFVDWMELEPEFVVPADARYHEVLPPSLSRGRSGPLSPATPSSHPLAAPCGLPFVLLGVRMVRSAFCFSGRTSSSVARPCLRCPPPSPLLCAARPTGGRPGPVLVCDTPQPPPPPPGFER